MSIFIAKKLNEIKKCEVSKGEPDSPKFHKIKRAQTCGGHRGDA